MALPVNPISALRDVSCQIPKLQKLELQQHDAVVTQCYLPPDTSERALLPNPSHAGWYSIYLPRMDGRLSWPSWFDSVPAGSWTSDLSITSPMLNHCTTNKDSPESIIKWLLRDHPLHLPPKISAPQTLCLAAYSTFLSPSVLNVLVYFSLIDIVPCK